MLRSIDHCHRQNIVHRDVKLENFLADTDEAGNIVIKLTDFGLACTFEWEKPPTVKCGSILSVAPEMLGKKSYCHKVDMWGLGVILHELVST
jgi:calcium-dependent protein kinase